jgi:hypothetical protein
MLSVALPVVSASKAAFVAGSAGFGSASTVEMVVVVVVVVLVVVVLVVVVLVVVVLVVVVLVVVVEGVVVEVVLVGLAVEVVLVDGAPPADDAPAHPARTSDAATMVPRQATRKRPVCTMATVPGTLLRGQDRYLLPAPTLLRCAREGGGQHQRQSTRPRTRRTCLDNPATPPDYAGSRERDPAVGTHRIVRRTAGNRRAPTWPAPTGASADAFQPSSSAVINATMSWRPSGSVASHQDELGAE